MDTPVAQRIVTVAGENGLHMRPAELFSRLANSFQSEIEVAYDSVCVDGKSIINVLTLGAAPGALLQITARGADAEQAIEALARLVESGFDHQQVTSRDAAADGAP